MQNETVTSLIMTDDPNERFPHLIAYSQLALLTG